MSAVVCELAVREQRWNLVALSTPRVRRHCPRCGDERPFFSSDRFRVNAQKRRLDVWLVYKCQDCDGSWNCEVRARVRPEDLDPAELDAYLVNDAARAWACAFDAALLARAGARADFDVPYHVERIEDVLDGPLRIHLALAQPIEVRLDRLIARELGCSRAEVARAFAAGRLRVTPEARDPLRRPAAGGQTLWWAPRPG